MFYLTDSTLASASCTRKTSNELPSHYQPSQNLNSNDRHESELNPRSCHKGCGCRLRLAQHTTAPDSHASPLIHTNTTPPFDTPRIPTQVPAAHQYTLQIRAAMRGPQPYTLHISTEPPTPHHTPQIRAAMRGPQPYTLQISTEPPTPHVYTLQV